VKFVEHENISVQHSSGNLRTWTKNISLFFAMKSERFSFSTFRSEKTSKDYEKECRHD
jgi:hypothetical protein